MVASLSTLAPKVANDDTRDAGAFAALRVAIAVGFLASIALTYPLWLGERAFPLVAVDPRVPSLPPPFDVGVLLLLGTLLATTIVVPSGIVAVGIIAVTSLLWAQDQNRIHPWAYFFILVYGALADLWIKPHTQRKPADTITLLQFIVTSTYAWTGLQKLRTNYFTELVPTLIASSTTPPSVIATTLLYVAPFIEIALALGLLVHPTRRLAVMGIVLLHSGIILMASPLGRNENYSVIPWNLTMACVAILLFWRSKTTIRALAGW
jgi:hypothetical protein